MSEELLPCPFCGGEASAEGHIRYSTPLSDTWWADDSPITEAFYVNCMACGAVSRSGLCGGYQTKDEAIARWNTRPALIDHLEADGMVLVPREPTEAMLQAGALNLFGSASEDWRDDAREVWSAMLSALPVLGVGR